MRGPKPINTPIPEEDEFIRFLSRGKISSVYLGNILRDLRRVIREYGSIPTDLNKFTDEYIIPRKFGRVRRVHLKIAVRRYCEYREERYGEPFIDT